MNPLRQQIAIKNTLLLITHEMVLSELLDYYLHNPGMTAKWQHINTLLGTVSFSEKSSELLEHEIPEYSAQEKSFNESMVNNIKS